MIIYIYIQHLKILNSKVKFFQFITYIMKRIKLLSHTNINILLLPKFIINDITIIIIIYAIYKL